MRTHSMIQNYNFFLGVQPMSFSQHLKRLSAASPRHKGWAAARQLWALRCYPQALQLNFLYSVFIMQSQITEKLKPRFLYYCYVKCELAMVNGQYFTIHHLQTKLSFIPNITPAISPSCYPGWLCPVQPKAK